MSKLLIALLALNIGVSLSKVFIFTWKSNYFCKKKQLFSKKEKVTGYSLVDVFILKKNKLNQ
jgi:hypothetical protein